MIDSPRILVVNPNSSESMTQEIKENVISYFMKKDITIILDNISYYTGPSTSPNQISDIETSLQSRDACLPELINPNNINYFNNFDGILVACFSDHPLVQSLSEFAMQNHSKTIIAGLLNTTISFCSLFGDRTFSILTSNNEWIDILNNAIEKNYLTKSSEKYWKGTVATNLEVLNLHDIQNYSEIVKIIEVENIQKLHSDFVILGCAGFSAIYEKLIRTFVDNEYSVTFIEPVTMGIETLLFMLK